MKKRIAVNGAEIFLDEDRWVLSNDPCCTIMREDKKYVFLQNKNGFNIVLPKKTITKYELISKDNEITLTPSLYEYYVVDSCKKKTIKFNKNFNKNADLIFRNKAIVMSRAEYYLLTPSILDSGAAYIGKVHYTLGSLMEAWEHFPELYFPEFDKHKEMYLLSLFGTPLSGINIKSFWCKADGRVIHYGKNGPRLSDKLFIDSFRFFKKAVESENYCKLDFQDVILNQLLDEINNVEPKIPRQ